MIEIHGGRVYWNKVFACYAEHSLLDRIDGDICVLFSHRHGRNLLNAAGKVWIGNDDGSMPRPEIVIGTTVGSRGLLPDPAMMEHLTELIQVREDDGLKTRVVVTENE